MAELAFWASAGVLTYVYAGYPFLIYLFGRLASRRVRAAKCFPSVSVLIPAFNEAQDIVRTITNKLGLDYPPDKLDVIVVSDDSTDGTDELVQDLAAKSAGRLRLLRQSPRQGKTAALNMAVRVAQGEILVFSDANSLYAGDALSHLVASFADPRVGYVTGQMIYTNPDGVLIGDGCSAYMRYENLLRRYETLLGSVVGVDGGVDAMRKELYRPMRSDQLPDLILPLSVVVAGHRVIYDPAAVVREPALVRSRDEYSMRVRVAIRALWALRDMKRLLNPFRYSVYAWQLFSHKILRYLAFIPLIVLLLASLLLYREDALFQAALIGQLAFYGTAGIGYMVRDRNGTPLLLSFPYYFTLLNLASAEAFFKFLVGKKQILWKPRTGDA
jgi:cellulose synthase/poly-beta-1,6-N-acetylglucosamine synthase-like glycosyltransferase